MKPIQRNRKQQAEIVGTAVWALMIWFSNNSLKEYSIGIYYPTADYFSNMYEQNYDSETKANVFKNTKDENNSKLN